LAGYIGLGEERETDRERNRREIIEKAMQVAAKKQYEWGRYTFVDLFALTIAIDVLFGLI